MTGFVENLKRTQHNRVWLMNSLYIVSAVILLAFLLCLLDLFDCVRKLTKPISVKQVHNANWLLKRYLHFKEQGDIHSIVQWQTEVHEHLQRVDIVSDAKAFPSSADKNVVPFPSKDKT